ncbi:amino acid adenylation domain-containing protein [Streptomyces rishiriensis]|uniref:amino acid adenylation domain-containing protein n=1 Tax=Streptomyces rishiriensis TaxID=68264 RepID=UPI0033D0C9C5
MLSHAGKEQTLLELRTQLLTSRPGSPDLHAALHPSWRSHGDPYGAFPLTDLQAAHLVTRDIPDDPVGCHTYLEFSVADLDVGRLQQAWRRLLAVHPMLRLRVGPDGTQQVAAKAPDEPFVSYDVPAGCAALEAHLQTVRREMSHRLYRPGEWPLFDIRVTQGPRSPARVHVSMDSWIVDGASAEILYRQWRELYNRPDAQVPLPTATFRDFVLSMRAFEDSTGYRRCLDYWAEKLRPLPPGARLPYRSGTGRANSDGRRRRLGYVCDPDAWQRIKATATAEGVSPTVVVLGCFLERLRASGDGEQFGIHFAQYNRPAIHEQLDQVVGPFASTTVFQAGPEQGGQLQAYQRQLLRDLEHGYVGGVTALRTAAAAATAAGESVDRDPIQVAFSSGLNVGTPDAGPSWLDDVDYSVSQTAGIDLDCQVRSRADGIHLTWDIADERLEREEVDAMFERFCADLSSRHPARFAAPSEAADAVLAQHRALIEATEPSTETVPGTPLQQWYLTHRLTDPSGPAPMIYREFSLASLDTRRLQAALDTVVQRSPALRAFVRTEQGDLIQFGDALCPLPVEDLPGSSGPELEASLERSRTQMIEEAHERRGWPAFSIRILRLGDGSARLLLLLDPVVFDGYGTWLFCDELLRRYDTGNTDVDVAPRGFAEYARARRRYTNSDKYTADQLYWKRRFRDMPSGPSWSNSHADHPGGGIQRIDVDVPNWDAVRRRADGLGVSPAAVVLAVYADVLHRWSGGDDITVTTVHYQDRLLLPEFAHCYGDFSGLAWVSTTGDQTSFEQSVHGISDTLRRDRQHDWGNPFEALRTGGTAGGHPGSAVLTDCIGAPVPAYPGIAEIGSRSNTPGVDIDLLVIENGCSLGSHWQIRPDRVPAAAATGMVEEYLALLERLSHPDASWQQPLADLLVADSGQASARGADHTRAGDELNRTDASYDRERCLHTLVSEQAARRPDRVALVAEDGTLTYGQLESRANQLARYLQRRGTQPGDLVGVLLDNSPDMVITVLAIMKAGAGFVPLPVADPPERIVTMMSRAAVSMVVSTFEFARAVLPASDAFLLLDQEQEGISRELADRPPDIEVRADDVAYVMFTSGSTGEPKGVVVQHRPVVNLITWAHRTFEFSERDRVLSVNPLGFDLSVFDLFGLLSCGGSVRTVAEADRRNPSRLAALLVDEPITFWNSAPAYLQFILPDIEALASSSRGRLRLVFLSGDWIPLTLPDAVRAAFPTARVIGLGGATEATVWSNFFEIEEVRPEWTSIPYGQPIDNARYYVLAEDLQPVPPGTPGELFIGGECLALGYINQPDLTAARFIDDPFHERPGMRMYRTGDLARLMPSAAIELMGRVDQQVKIRGFRIELGEVEAALSRVGLAGSVAVVREDTPGSRRIVAFTGPTGSTPRSDADDAGLQRHLHELLPDYMVPAQVLELPHLPLTANGKIDRRLLAIADLPVLRSGGCQATEAEGDPGAGPDTGMPEVPEVDCTHLTAFIRATLAEILMTEPGTLEPDTHFNTLGVTSLHFAQISTKLGQLAHTRLNAAKLFHCTSITDIVTTICERYPAVARAAVAPRADQSAVTPTEAVSVEAPSAGPCGAAQTSGRPTATTKPADGAVLGCTPSREIAVVGIHCVMPGSSGPAAFWETIVDGRDCIVRVPAEHGNWSTHSGNHPAAPQGGFISGIDRFDAAFFSIPPREAELMDPRQRMLLEGVWQTLEDAGYSRSELLGREIGVYIGALGDEYASLLRQAGCAVDEFSLTGTGRSFLANRVSHYFDWHGPSEVVDTTCSSSLVALHNAARAIEHGDCTMAIVGGLNIMIDELPHLGLAKAGVLSPDGACRTFDAGANGYVRSEGMGLALLKPLDRAEADHDHIYAVIDGTAVNHGGRASALTAPNPRAQAQVVMGAHRRSRVRPRQIGYLECHGTGTPLGDPIEIEGLNEAFSALYTMDGEPTPESGRIGIGSIKTNVGHLEGAAGIAGVLKVILMLRHRMLPPLVHFRSLNPQIDLDTGPFSVQTERTEWACPVSNDGRLMPRAAGVSAFGFGGVNAHVVIREYPELVAGGATPTGSNHVIVPLSARSREQLAERAARLMAAIDTAGDALRLEDIAFTLAVGREAMRERAAIVTSSTGELAQQLDAVRRGVTDTDGVHLGSACTGHGNHELSGGTHTATAARSADVAREWVAGRAVDWRTSFADPQPYRTPLPGYPFSGVRLWPVALRAHSTDQPGPMVGPAADPPRTGSRFTLGADEPHIRDHVVGGARIAPAATCIALASGIAQRLRGSQPLTLTDLLWAQPLRFPSDQPVTLTLALVPDSAGDRLALRHDVQGTAADCFSAVLEAQGDDSRPSPSAAVPSIDTTTRRCNERAVGPLCYERMGQLGIDYGPSLRVVRTLWYRDDEALAYIASMDESTHAGCPVPPSLVDGAFQAILLHQIFARGQMELHVPFSVRRLVLHSRVPQECYVHVRMRAPRPGRHALPTYDVTVLDPNGTPVLEFEEATGVPAGSRIDAAVTTRATLHREHWRVLSSDWMAEAGALRNASQVTIGLPELADALASAGQHVLANVEVPTQHAIPGSESPVPWESLVQQSNGVWPQTIVIWYEPAALARLPMAEQLRYSFDTVFDLTKHLIRTPGTQRRTVVICRLSDGERQDAPVLDALAGFGRAVQEENPALRFKIVRVLGATPTSPQRQICGAIAGAVASAIGTEAADLDLQFDLVSGQHRVLCQQPTASALRTDSLPVTPDSVYLITGGAGGFGLHLAKSLLADGARVALTGRRPADEVNNTVTRLAPQSRLRYLQADVTDADSTRRMLSTVREELGPVRGVFHCAGTVNPGLVLHKSVEAARSVVSAKVLGTACIDEVTQQEPLDFFVLFSSLGAMTGQVGASDYAYASRFAALYADYRNSLERQGLRRGTATSVSWPPLTDGGMQVPPVELAHLQSKGVEPIDCQTAIRVLAAGMRSGGGHYVCHKAGNTNALAAVDPWPASDRPLWTPKSEGGHQAAQPGRRGV